MNFDVDVIVVSAGPARLLAAETWPARPATDIGVRYATDNPLIIERGTVNAQHHPTAG
jgi:hypothetical protein